MTLHQFIERPSVFAAEGAAAKTVYAVTPADLEAAGADGKGPDAAALAWAKAAGFAAEAGSLLLVPGEDGAVKSALFGLGGNPAEQPFAAGRLSKLLPAGDWKVETTALTGEQVALGFALGAYTFPRYRSDKQKGVRLLPSESTDRADLERKAAAVTLVRDLVNTPTNDMGPADLEQAFRALGEHYGATVTSIVGDELLAQNFPLIHAVGRASTTAPRLLEMRWSPKGKAAAKSITLVGKGVCFDTGGLDIKTSTGMALMKKDMGGAANVMGLALMIMDANLGLDLRVLVPAVENSIAGDAFRPGDIYKSRKGITVQIDNTDAEGRLVLADALAYADETPSDLMIDMATLTGAARVALGAELAPYFTDDEALSASSARPRHRRATRCGACRSGWVMTRISARVRQTSPMPRAVAWRAHHRSPLPQAFRHRNEELGAFRHLCLGAGGKAACAGRRRCLRHSRALWRHPRYGRQSVTAAKRNGNALSYNVLLTRQGDCRGQDPSRACGHLT